MENGNARQKSIGKGELKRLEFFMREGSAPVETGKRQDGVREGLLGY